MKQYQHIREQIEQTIESGAWPIGYKLPKETELCAQFDVSRTTIRHALEQLVADGKLRRIKGTGTFVSRPQHMDKSTLFMQSFAEELKAQGLTSVTEVLEFRTIPATDPAVTHGLAVSQGQSVLKLRRLRYAAEKGENGPMVLTTSYFPADVGALVQQYDPERLSLYKILQLCGVLRVKSEKTISAARLPKKECRLLNAAEDDLFLSVKTVSRDRTGRPVEYCESVYPADRHVFTIHVTTE